MSALARAQRDEAAGDLATAGLRLASYLRTLAGKGGQAEPLPSARRSALAAYRPDIIEHLARLNLRMGDPAAAGQWYFIIDSADPDAAAAITRFESSRGTNPFQVWTALPPWVRNLPLDTYPPHARERVARIMPPFIKDRHKRRTKQDRATDKATSILITGCLIIVALAIIALLAIGGYTAVRWLFN